MRCQWGTHWDNLQPWIAARRYREFDVLDAQVYPLFNFIMSLQLLIKILLNRSVEARVPSFGFLFA